MSGNEARGLLKVAVLNHQARLEAVEHGYEDIILPFCVSTAYLTTKATFWVRLKWLITGRFTSPQCPKTEPPHRHDGPHGTKVA
jgi:nitric oxide reductase large subunit